MLSNSFHIQGRISLQPRWGGENGPSWLPRTLLAGERFAEPWAAALTSLGQEGDRLSPFTRTTPPRLWFRSPVRFGNHEHTHPRKSTQSSNPPFLSFATKKNLVYLPFHKQRQASLCLFCLHCGLFILKKTQQKNPNWLPSNNRAKKVQTSAPRASPPLPGTSLRPAGQLKC